MTPRIPYPVAPYLRLAGLGAALLGGSAASADERIILEVIGAVRMTGPTAIPPARAPQPRTETRRAREDRAERSIGDMAIRRH